MDGREHEGRLESRFPKVSNEKMPLGLARPFQRDWNGLPDFNMHSNKLKHLTSALWFAASLVVAAQAADQKQPNIVHIVADDLGWKDVGFNGCTDIKTPNLDKLAATGAKFTQFYTQSMCTPTRACLMTGRYPWRYGLQTMVIPGTASYGLDTSEYLMPQCLKDAGYHTANIGKWHLGHANLAHWPKQRGKGLHHPAPRRGRGEIHQQAERGQTVLPLPYLQRPAHAVSSAAGLH